MALDTLRDRRFWLVAVVMMIVAAVMSGLMSRPAGATTSPSTYTPPPPVPMTVTDNRFPGVGLSWSLDCAPPPEWGGKPILWVNVSYAPPSANADQTVAIELDTHGDVVSTQGSVYPGVMLGYQQNMPANGSYTFTAYDNRQLFAGTPKSQARQITGTFIVNCAGSTPTPTPTPTPQSPLDTKFSVSPVLTRTYGSNTAVFQTGRLVQVPGTYVFAQAQYGSKISSLVKVPASGGNVNMAKVRIGLWSGLPHGNFTLQVKMYGFDRKPLLGATGHQVTSTSTVRAIPHVWKVYDHFRKSRTSKYATFRIRLTNLYGVVSTGTHLRINIGRGYGQRMNHFTVTVRHNTQTFSVRVYTGKRPSDRNWIFNVKRGSKAIYSTHGVHLSVG